MLEMLMMVLMFLGGGGNDLLSTVDTDAYWKAKDVTVTVEQLLRDAKPGDAAPDIAQQIKDLGATEFAKREAARKALVAIGTPAAEQLQQAISTSKDAEVVAAAKEIVANLGAQTKARDIRQLMAIRTLGEKKSKEAAALLQELSTSTTPFVADYAKRSLAQIEGRDVPQLNLDRKALGGDAWLMPADCGTIAQQSAGMIRGLTISNLVDAMAPAPEAADAADEKIKLKERATKNVVSLLDRVGNVRIDSVAVGFSSTIDDDHGFGVVTIRGKWDKKAMAEAIRDMFDSEGDVGEPGATDGAPGIMPAVPPQPMPPMQIMPLNVVPMPMPPQGPQGRIINGNGVTGFVVEAVPAQGNAAAGNAVAGNAVAVAVPAAAAGVPPTVVAGGPVAVPAQPAPADGTVTQVAPALPAAPPGVVAPHHIVVGPVGAPMQAVPAVPVLPAQAVPPPPIQPGGPMIQIAPAPGVVQVGPGVMQIAPGGPAIDVVPDPRPVHREPLDLRGPVVLKGPDAAAIVVSDEQMIFISAPDASRAKITDAMLDAVKTGKGGVAGDAEMAGSLKAADMSLPVWGAMRVVNNYKSVELLAPFKMLTLSGAFKGTALDLTLTGTSPDPAAAADAVKGITTTIASALKEIAAGDNPDLEANGKALLAMLKKVQVHGDGVKTTVTATLESADVIAIMRLLPMGDVLDMLAAPDEDETAPGTIEGPGKPEILIDPVPPNVQMHPVPPRG